MACPHCGSWSVKADRSLAGRLVCGRCGKPLGPGAARRARTSGPSGFRGPSGPGRLSPWPWLGALLALSAGLAWLAESTPQRPGRSPSPAPNRTSQPWQ